MAVKKNNIIDPVSLSKIAEEMGLKKANFFRKLKAEDRFFDDAELEAFIKACEKVAGQFIGDIKEFVDAYQTKVKGTFPQYQKKS